MIRKELIVEGLSCQNCANKIESRVKQLSGIAGASVNLFNKKISVEINNIENFKDILNNINDIAKSYEPNVNVKEITSLDKYTAMKNKISKPEAVKFIIGAALFLTGLIFSLPYNFELFIFLASYILIGADVITAAAGNIKRGQIFDENFLMIIATIGAFCIGEFAEGVAVMLFYKIGEYFQESAVDKSRRSIASLMDIKPDFANLKTGGEIKKVSVYDVKPGDVIIIKAGEKVALDGVLLKGRGMLDTSALTGESMPREVSEGDEVLSGFINKGALLTVKVTKLFKDSTVSKILDLVQNASERKAKTEKFITRFARVYTPAVVFAALMLAVVPPLLNFGTYSQWVHRALVFLVVSCPCALVLSVPLSYFCAIGNASKNKVLIKGSNFIEALNYVGTVVFDKTGTLTKGKFSVTRVQGDENLLKYAAYAESFSNHPIASSILDAYNKETDKSRIENYEEFAGYGVKIKYDGKIIAAGGAKMMQKENVLFSEPDCRGTIVHVAADGAYLGYIVISDEIKSDSKATIEALKKSDITTVILSGDRKSTVEEIASELKIDRVYSELLPDEKVKVFEQIKNQAQKKVMYVGDGINDAPVLAYADIGVSMGGLGSDAAIEASDLVIMNDRPSRLVSVLEMAKKTRKIVWQNIIFSLFVKAVVIALGAYGMATMWGAVFADVGTALIAVLNATRLITMR